LYLLKEEIAIMWSSNHNIDYAYALIQHVTKEKFMSS